MNPRPPANVPTPLSLARRQLDQWRSRQQSRKRLPRELWSKAVALAREHGINKTARTLGLKYDSLKKHLEATPPGASGPRRPRPWKPISLGFCCPGAIRAWRGTLRPGVGWVWGRE